MGKNIRCFFVRHWLVNCYAHFTVAIINVIIYIREEGIMIVTVNEAAFGVAMMITNCCSGNRPRNVLCNVIFCTLGFKPCSFFLCRSCIVSRGKRCHLSIGTYEVLVVIKLVSKVVNLLAQLSTLRYPQKNSFQSIPFSKQLRY